MVRKGQTYFVLLLAETLSSILKTALEDIIKDDMMTDPKAEHCMMEGGLPFPHTMALVCRHWRDIMSSAPELWTRIFCVLPQENSQRTLSSQLEETSTHPVHLTIVNQHYFREVFAILCCVAPHIGRLGSFRIRDFYGAYNQHLDILTGYAPLTQVFTRKHFSNLTAPPLRSFMSN
ncbi:uncharacterized protein EDB91DRAFT_1344745, partial [Suillus paluster]|uniref:uncharacterized protein n=1 Tax=Suillus paluster TaxID=48578 RepID=UPI001B886DB9